MNEKRQYRVLLPVDFGDGTVHQFGAMVELDMDTAKAYQHALAAIEGEGK